MKWEKKSRSAGRKRITALQGGTSVRFSTGARFRGGSSTAIGIKTMRDRDDQTGSAVGNQRCAQTRSHAPLTTDNGQLTTGRKSLRLRYERVKPCVSIICRDLFAKSLILHMAQMGEGRSRPLAAGASWRSRPSHEQQIPPLGLKSSVGMTTRERERCEERTAKSGSHVSSVYRVEAKRYIRRQTSRLMVTTTMDMTMVEASSRSKLPESVAREMVAPRPTVV